MIRGIRILSVFTVVASVLICLGYKLSAGAADLSTGHIKNYAALGDSYSSGVGAGDYYKESGSCLKSTNSYGKILARSYGINHTGVFEFNACSGATLEDINNNQLNIPGDVELISLTGGGNDAGFTGVITACALTTSTICRGIIDTAIAGTSKAIEDRYDLIFKKLANTVPNARIVVLGYPRLFDPNAEKCSDKLFGNDKSKRDIINYASERLDSVIENAVTKSKGKNQNIKFVNVSNYFAGHEICSNHSWINDFNTTEEAARYHPNRFGQLAYYTALKENL